MRIPRLYLYPYLAVLLIAGVLSSRFIYENVSRVIIEKKRDIDITVNGKCALIMDADNGSVLYGKNPDSKYPPASTAKVMTAVVAIENMDLARDVIPGSKVVQVEPTIAGLKPGVKYKLRDLISAILIKSANDAAFVIAEAVAGSEKAFSGMMNEKAAQIGMKNTFFVRASGLPTGRKDSQYTTAEDLAVLMRYARRYHVILENMSKKEKTIIGSDGKKIYLRTHNKALFKTKNAPWGKTGYTREAKRTFIGTDPGADHKIVFGLLQSNNLWQDILTLKNKGLLLYNVENTGFIKALITWISRQRENGRDAISGVEA
jgi:D-alanyl-D-alanine carboxypeptidase